MKGMIVTEEEKKVYEQIENAVRQLNGAIDFASRHGVEVELERFDHQTVSSMVIGKVYTFKAVKVLQYAPN